MLCPFCNAFRPANNAPCPQCKAPSSLAEEVGWQNQTSPPAASWGGPITPASSNGWGNQMTQGSFQGGMNDNALWGQVMAPQPVRVNATTVPFDATGAIPGWNWGASADTERNFLKSTDHP